MIPAAAAETELTAQEAKVANLLSMAWNEFARLNRDDSGRRDFLHHIQAAQYIALAGPGIRQLNTAQMVNQAMQEQQARDQGGEVQGKVYNEQTESMENAPPAPPAPPAPAKRVRQRKS